MTKGTYKYIPKEMVEELELTKTQFNIMNDSDCFRVIAKNNHLAKELKFNLDFGFNKRRRR